MRVNLPDKLAKLVQQKLDVGLYASSEEVIEEALKLLDQRDQKLAALRSDIREGLASGVGRPFDEEVVEGIQKLGRRQAAQRNNPG